MLNLYQLVMHAGPTPGKTFIIDNPEMIVGRDLRNTVVINDVEVSRSHCRISTYENGIYIEDLNSTNGTFINGTRISAPTIIAPGDILKVGETVTMVLEALETAEVKTVVTPSSPTYIPVAVQPEEPAAEPHITTTPPPTQAAYITPQEEDEPAEIKTTIAEPKPLDEPMTKPIDKERISKGKAILITIIFMLFLLAIIVGAFLWYVDVNYLWCDFFGFMIKGC